MKFMIAEKDSPTVARLKLLYLTPVFLVSLIPLCLWIGFWEYGFDGFKMLARIIRTGRYV